MLKKLLIVVVIAVLGWRCAEAQNNGNDLAIIVGKSSPLEDLTSQDLLKIFRAEKRKSADGVKFVVVMRETGSAERGTILSKLYQMDEAEYSKYFLRATFVGMVQAAPREMPSAATMRQFVAGTPGAIGYVRASEADGAVKVLKIDGKSPGDPDYKLGGK